MRRRDRCPECKGKKVVCVEESVPDEELSDRDRAWKLLNGGRYVVEREVPCPACGGSGRRGE